MDWVADVADFLIEWPSRLSKAWRVVFLFLLPVSGPLYVLGFVSAVVIIVVFWLLFFGAMFVMGACLALGECVQDWVQKGDDNATS